MSEQNEETKRVEDWLTLGRPRTIRTRGAVRTRGAATAASGAVGRHIERIDDLLEQLKETVPEVPWVVVVEGSLDAFSEAVCQQIKEARESSKFWVVGPEQESPRGDAITTLAPLRLDPQNADDLRFLENLVADLVIVAREPQPLQKESLLHWSRRARYILVEELDASLADELRMPELTGGSKDEVYVIRSKE